MPFFAAAPDIAPITDLIATPLIQFLPARGPKSDTKARLNLTARVALRTQQSGVLEIAPRSISAGSRRAKRCSSLNLEPIPDAASDDGTSAGQP